MVWCVDVSRRVHSFLLMCSLSGSLITPLIVQCAVGSISRFTFFCMSVATLATPFFVALLLSWVSLPSYVRGLFSCVTGMLVSMFLFGLYYREPFKFGGMESLWLPWDIDLFRPLLAVLWHWTTCHPVEEAEKTFDQPPQKEVDVS
jgi:hypothetical protein